MKKQDIKNSEVNRGTYSLQSGLTFRFQQVKVEVFLRKYG